MIKTNLKDDNQSAKYINKSEISTAQIKYGYAMQKSVKIVMKNGEEFEVYYNEADFNELIAE